MARAQAEATVISIHDAMRDRRLRRTASRPTRVLIAGGRSLLRAGVRVLLERDPRIEVVGEAESADAALVLAGELLPDVVLVDAATDASALAATGAAVLLLAEPLDENELFSVLRAGARGVLSVDAGPAELTRAVRTVARGEAVLSSTAISRLLHLLSPDPQLA